MKLLLWVEAVNTENSYVRKEPLRKRGPFVANPYEIAQIIDDALHQYYVIEHGQEVPQWRYIKDQDWWVEYLKNLGIDPRNP
jgi:hypothetical protein